MIKLHQGLALKPEGAYRICRGGPTRIVALMGPIGCGKTTLIAEIFQAFLNGTVAGYSFRRSDTLLAFEERCFNSRTASDADLASMPRTSGQVGIEFYHLEVRRDNDQLIRRLLILDLSGELYEGAIHVEEDAAKLGILRDVDQLVQLMDGKKMVSGATRDKVYSDAKALLRRLSEVNSIRSETPLQTVVSKIDQLLPDAGTEESLRAIEAKVRERLASDVRPADFQFRAIAASPAPETTVPTRFGVSELFGSWLADDGDFASSPMKVKTAGARLMHRLGEVWMPERYEHGE